jgi:hypothetical protein
MGNQNAILSGSSFSAQTVTGSLAKIFDLDTNQANIRDVDGTSATFTTVSGTTVQAHTLDTDKLTANDVDGTSLTITGIVSGSTVDAHTIDVDKLEVRDLDFTNLSGSGTATIHKVNSDVLSGSKAEIHSAVIDKLNVNEITSTDVVKKATLNSDIVKNVNSAHGGIVFANGQLSVGWKRRIFSRSTKKIVNRTQPTQGSGSLHTTCSLSEIRMVSGSEMVYFNGLLLVKSNAKQSNYKGDGDYRIDYNSGGGLQPGSYKFVFTSGSIGATGNKTYGPANGSGKAQFLEVVSSGSERYLFFLDNGGTTTLPRNNNVNIFTNTTLLRQVKVEAVSGVTDWRTVVTNFFNAMNAELDTNADLATVTLSGAAQQTHTASITVTYKAGTIEGGIVVAHGKYNQDGSPTVTTRLRTAGFTPSANDASSGDMPISNNAGADKSGHAGEPANSGVFVETSTSGSTPIAGTEIFLHESLALDSDDIVVVQYLSGSHQF